MTVTYNPIEVERLIAEAREDNAQMVPAPWEWLDGVLLWNEEADHCVLQHGGPLWPVSEEHKIGIARTRNNLATMAEQLEAARAEIERLSAPAIEQPNDSCPCAHTTPCHERCTCVNPLSSSGCRRCCSYGSDEQQRAAAESLAAMTDQLEAARAEIDRLSALAIVSPDDLRDVVNKNTRVEAENDRLRKAFDEVIKSLDTGGTIRSAFCTWCNQRWPQLDGETYEVARKYTMDHAEACPANVMRIERDAARADILRLTESARAAAENWMSACRQRDEARAEVERMRPVFDASLAMRAADRGDAIRDDMSISEAEAIVAEDRSARALMRWRNAVDAVLPNPNARRDPSDNNTDEKG